MAMGPWTISGCCTEPFRVMIKSVIFDFGNVIVPWNPRRLYDKYFGDKEKSDWFVRTVCPMEWHSQVDRGVPVAEAVAQRTALFPEWKREIELYFEQWEQMFAPETEGISAYITRLKDRGFKVYGLTNWSAELFPRTENDYPAFNLLDGMVISGAEKLLKPEKEIYLRLLDRYGLQAGECIFIDDNPANVEGARELGIHSVTYVNLEQAEQDVERMISESKQENQ